MNALLPCPFCGGEAVAVPRTCNPTDPYRPDDRAAPRVRCCSCYAEAAGRSWTGVETAVEAWNRRAAQPAQPTEGS